MWREPERFARPARIAGMLLVVGWLCGCDSRSSTTKRGGETAVVSRGDTTVTARDTGTPRVPAAAPRDTPRGPRRSSDVAPYNVSQWRRGDPTACGLREPPPAAGSVVVHFGCTARDGTLLNAVPARRVQVPSGADPKETALRALLRGPTAEEVRAGYMSNFGATSANVGFTLRAASGLATVDFDPAITNVKYIFLGQMDVAQIIVTLGQFSDVRRVAILIEGEVWCRKLQAGC
jgi:hypothetical protein